MYTTCVIWILMHSGRNKSLLQAYKTKKSKVNHNKIWELLQKRLEEITKAQSLIKKKVNMFKNKLARSGAKTDHITRSENYLTTNLLIDVEMSNTLTKQNSVLILNKKEILLLLLQRINWSKEYDDRSFSYILYDPIKRTRQKITAMDALLYIILLHHWKK